MFANHRLHNSNEQGFTIILTNVKDMALASVMNTISLIKLTVFELSFHYNK